MRSRFAVTPFFLERPEPALRDVAPHGSWLNEPADPAFDAIHRPLADFVAATAAAGERPVSLAGDCCAAIPVAAGLRRAGLDPLLVWLDAHGDFNTPETSPSGFLGGMPLAMLVGRGDPALCSHLGLEPLREEDVVLTDARDLDPGEREALRASRVRHLRDSRTLAEHLATLPPRPLHVHFDTDLVDPRDAPAMGYPTPGGPSAAELGAVFRALADGGLVVAVSMTAWDLGSDVDGRTGAVCQRLLQTLVGP